MPFAFLRNAESKRCCSSGRTDNGLNPRGRISLELSAFCLFREFLTRALALAASPSPIATAASSARASLLLRRREWDHVTVNHWRIAIACPCVHYLPALLEQVAPTISSLNLVANRVRQCHFAGLSRKVRALTAPIAEGAAEAMRSKIATAHTPEKHQERHVAQWPS